MSTTMFTPKFDYSGRDIACFLFAAGVHSLLLLWTGGIISIPEKTGGVGDMLVAVDFMSEVPNYDAPGGGAPERPQGFLARVKSIMKGPGAAGKKPEIAMGNAPTQVEAPKPSWTKTDTFKDKNFADKKGFEGLVEKDALDIAKGQSQDVVVKPSQGNFKKAEANLKENTFKVAKTDMPFKIASAKDTQQLANVNAIPMAVGRTTTANVKSLDGGPGNGPAMQSKSFANTGASTMKSFGSGGSSSGNSGASGGLAMGSGAGAAAPAGGGFGAGGGGGGGGSGYSSGTGSGRGTGSGNGFGSGTGRSWGGGTGAGMGSGSMQALPRNTVDDAPAGTKSVYAPDTNITGALSKRPVVSKAQPRYEIDARVALRFRVDWSGRVLDGIIVEISSGSPTFDQKVIAALKQWTFSRLSSDRSNEIQEGVITFVFKGV